MTWRQSRKQHRLLRNKLLNFKKETQTLFRKHCYSTCGISKSKEAEYQIDLLKQLPKLYTKPQCVYELAGKVRGAIIFFVKKFCLKRCRKKFKTNLEYNGFAWKETLFIEFAEVIKKVKKEIRNNNRKNNRSTIDRSMNICKMKVLIMNLSKGKTNITKIRCSNNTYTK